MESDWWWRPPHIHYSIFGPSWMNRYVTQFFRASRSNETDLLLNAASGSGSARPADLRDHSSDGWSGEHAIPPRLCSAWKTFDGGAGLRATHGLPTSPYCTIGPFFPGEFADGCGDLTNFAGKQALGQHILLTGIVVEEGNRPIRNAIVRDLAAGRKWNISSSVRPALKRRRSGILRVGSLEPTPRGAIHFERCCQARTRARTARRGVPIST